MTTPVPTDEAVHAAPDSDVPAPLYKRGDMIFIPCHSGKFVAEVVHVYKDLAEAEEEYPKSYRTILQHPLKKGKPNQYHYYAEVANKTRKPLGVCEEYATLKRRAPGASPEA